MTGEESYTFSSLMNYLVEIEETATSFYEAAGKVANSELSDLFYLFMREHLKAKEEMKNVGRRSITEFTLEPIKAPNLERYIEKIRRMMEIEEYSYLEKALFLEESFSELLRVTSQRIMVISADAGLLLNTLSRRRSSRVSILNKKRETV